MKKFYFLLAAFITLGFNAQEAGKAGELLKNEASKSEMAAPKTETYGRNNSQNGGFRTDNGVINNSKDRGNPTYQWNQNYSYGYAEMFIRIPEQGLFTIEIGDQRISNASGKFRFFDLNSGNNVISIYDRNFLVYRTRINVRNNTRLVLDYFTYKGLYLLGTYQLRNNYGDVWNDTWNNPYGNNNGNSWDPYNDNNNQNGYGFGNDNGYGNNGYGNYYSNVMNEKEFSSFMQALKRQSFDDSKMDFLKAQLKRTSFNTMQIKAIMKEFSFDKARLEFAKIAYKNCVDKRNYFELNEAFDFESYARELNKFIQNQR